MLQKCLYSYGRKLQYNIFLTFARPVLEYNYSPNWSPHFAKNINAIERVQKHLLRILKST